MRWPASEPWVVRPLAGRLALVMISRRPSAIIFDVGGTLLEAENPQLVALRGSEETAAVDPVRFASAVESVVAEWWAAGGRAAEQDLAATWSEHYRRALVHLGFEGDSGGAAERLEARFLTTGWRVYADVLPALSLLRRFELPLGIVSNWPPTLEATLERAALRQFFDVVVSSGETGFAKPRPEIFQVAAERLGLDAEGIWYIGDSMHDDVVGARGAGMVPLLLDRRERHVTHPERLRGLDEIAARLSV